MPDTAGEDAMAVGLTTPGIAMVKSREFERRPAVGSAKPAVKGSTKRAVPPGTTPEAPIWVSVQGSGCLMWGLGIGD